MLPFERQHVLLHLLLLVGVMVVVVLLLVLLAVLRLGIHLLLRVVVVVLLLLEGEAEFCMGPLLWWWGRGTRALDGGSGDKALLNPGEWGGELCCLLVRGGRRGWWRRHIHHRVAIWFPWCRWGVHVHLT